jgi:hypothetical protein
MNLFNARRNFEVQRKEGCIRVAPYTKIHPISQLRRNDTLRLEAKSCTEE